MVVCGNLVRLEIRMGVQVGSRAARNFQARPVEERRYPAHASFFEVARRHGLISVPCYLLASVIAAAVDRMGCWSPCPAARQRRLLLRAGVVASGHVTALDPPRGPYLPREVSAAAAGQPRKRGRTGERIRFCFGRGRLHGGCGVSPTCCGAILCRRGRLDNVSSLSGHWRGARRISRLRHARCGR